MAEIKKIKVNEIEHDIKPEKVEASLQENNTLAYLTAITDSEEGKVLYNENVRMEQIHVEHLGTTHVSLVAPSFTATGEDGMVAGSGSFNGVATYAIYDDLGQNINSYVKKIELDGNKIESYHGDGTKGEAVTLPTAGDSLGLVKSGGDVTITNGVITVNNDSHSHSTYETKDDASIKLSEAKTYTDNSISNLIGAAPEALDTLEELAEALNNEEDFAATLTQELTDIKNSITNISLTPGATGPKGDTGATGPTGLTGATGATGTGIISSSTAPTSQTGNIGNIAYSYKIKAEVLDRTPKKGDTILYSYYLYPVVAMMAENSTLYAYLGTRTSIRGSSGSAATIKVGTVTTGEEGSSATVTNVGSTTAAQFNFVIPRGNTGPTGPTGPTGKQGATGATGASGKQGNTGATGASGKQGNTGATGATGASGAKGATGASGASGKQGATGATGAQGVTPTIKAEAGTKINTVGTPTVTASTTGTTTTFTFNYLKGQSGTNGAKGATGATGPKGDTGATGPKGDANDFSGQVPVSKGGTGKATLTSGSYLIGNGTSEVSLKTPAEVLSDIGALSLAGGTMTGEIVIGQGDNNGIQIGTDGRINATKGTTKTNTILGVDGENALIGSIAFNTTLRGFANRPTYNGVDMALYSDVNNCATSNHTHGLLNHDLNIVVPATTDGSSWNIIDEKASNTGGILKAIRMSSQAPAWLENNYGTGVFFGGGDTRGAISLAYGSPSITLAGGTKDRNTNWHIKMTGTAGTTYNLDNIGKILDGENIDGGTW